jgi:hypothetical protein
MSELGDRLKELRAKAIAGGMRLLSIEEINEQLAGCEELYARAERAEQESASLLAEVDRLKSGGCARDQRLTQYCAEAEALRADAERYRWLRGNRFMPVERGGHGRMAFEFFGDPPSVSPTTDAEQLDAAIDAARRE